MKKTNKYSINNFYIGEIYLYKKFGNFLTGETIEEEDKRMKTITTSGAINFQPDLISRHIDWDNKREYTGFLTIFYKQDNKYICLHDGKTYELNNQYIIENLVLLKDLLPRIHSKSISKISMYEALELFDILFKNDINQELYNENKQNISNFVVGDIALREKTIIENPKVKMQYINLPHHIMLSKSYLEMYSFKEKNYINIVYRCLFLKEGVDLYNLHNHQYYNHHEDNFDNIILFKDYLKEFEIEPESKSITINKALKLFKRTI